MRSSGDSDDFSIWSSSRSAVASNLHTLPYEVVVLELLAPEYSGGLDLYLQIQNQSGALRVDALSNMATPPMYAAIIQHLHVIHDVLLLTLVIRVLLRPRGVRT